MKYILFSLFLTAIFSFLTQSVGYQSRYIIKWRSVNCTYNTKYVRHLSCDIMQPEQLYMTSYLIYAIDINPGYIVNARLDIPRPNSQLMNILNLDVDVCKFFAKEHENNLVKIARQSFDLYGNYTACPQYKDVTLGLFNWTLDVTKLPYAPESDFILNFVFLLPRNIETMRFKTVASLELRRKRPMRVIT